MTRIHITASGKAAPCTASIRNCPRGGSDQHYDSMKDAVVAMHSRKAEASDAQRSAAQLAAKRAASLTLFSEWLGGNGDDAEDEAIIAEYKQEHAKTIEEGSDPSRGWTVGVRLTNVGAPVLTKEYNEGGVYNLQPARGAVPGQWAHHEAEMMDARIRREKAEAWNQIPYTQEEVDAITFEELRKAELLTEGWTVAHGHKASALGTTFYKSKQIQFSNLWSPILTKQEMADTITHEVAHAKVGTGHGHDETWQATHRAMGGSGEEKHHSDDPVQKEAYQERFRKFYPNGLTGGTRGGVGKKELDPAIIEKLKMKYLGAKGHPFDESGLSIPELLQMAQRGELG